MNASREAQFARLQAIFDFLTGAKPIDGAWFGESELPGRKYAWRKYVHEAEQHVASLRTPPPVDDKLELLMAAHGITGDEASAIRRFAGAGEPQANSTDADALDVSHALGYRDGAKMLAEHFRRELGCLLNDAYAVREEFDVGDSELGSTPNDSPQSLIDLIVRMEALDAKLREPAAELEALP